MKEFEDEEEEKESVECYGHGGDDAPTYDWAASYPESHYVPTDDQYQYKESEDTYATNQRALRELREFERLQEEDSEYEDRLREQQEEEEWEEEQQELEYNEDVAESEANESDAKMAKCETEEERDAVKAENDEAHRRLNDARYDSGHHFRGM